MNNRTIVSMRYCAGYDDYPALKAQIAAGIEDLGGIGRFVSPGERVLLKPNLLMRKSPEEAATTHPAVVRALAEIVIARGASAVIGDSPAGPFTEFMLRGIYKASGMARAAEESGAALNANFAVCERENPGGLLLKRIVMADMLGEADKVISVAKLKTHGMMTYTGAVKNMFGAIPGLKKAEYHNNMAVYANFADALVDICECAAPALSVIDGVVGMEGPGPSAGRPRALNCVICSESPYHADKAACAVIGLKPGDVPVLAAAVRRGLSSADLDDIDFAGEPLSRFAVNDFDVRVNKSASMGGMAVIGGFLRGRPVFAHDKCTGCGVCARSCPPRVITMKNRRPYVNLKGCLRCYCCHELCPFKAVEIRTPPLGRVLEAGRKRRPGAR